MHTKQNTCHVDGFSHMLIENMFVFVCFLNKNPLADAESIFVNVRF